MLSTFTTTLTNVLITLFYMLPGYVVHKIGLTKQEHLPTLSALLVYACGPFLEISAFMALDFSMEMLCNMGLFFVITIISQIIVLFLLYLLLKKDYKNASTRLVTIASVFGNVGFFGMPVIKAIFPQNPEVACFSAVYMVSMNILVFTVGIFCITGDKKFISVKNAIINPNVLGLCAALPLFITGAKNYLPEVVINGINTIGNITTPLCMFILGIRLATIPVKKLFANKKVYLVSFLKLIVFPLICYGVAAIISKNEFLRASALILSATPCAAVVQSFSEIYDGDKEGAANCIIITTFLCVLTIPLLSLLV